MSDVYQERQYPCPKCGSTSIFGPYYREGKPGGIDWLIYRCSRCGFEQKTPPNDRKDEMK